MRQVSSQLQIVNSIDENMVLKRDRQIKNICSKLFNCTVIPYLLNIIVTCVYFRVGCTSRDAPFSHIGRTSRSQRHALTSQHTQDSMGYSVLKLREFNLDSVHFISPTTLRQQKVL